jgi:RHS repeat-associated protein
MSGISDKALKTPYAENKYRYNDGNELQNKEFSDGSGLETYDAENRMYDPQLGRFWQIDPMVDINESSSPYSFANNNPILLNDPMGLDTAHYGDPAYVSAATKSTTSGPDIAADFGPAPTSVADPIQATSSTEEVSIGNESSGSESSFGLTLVALGEATAETAGVTITGLGSIPVVIGGAVGYGIMKWAWPKGPIRQPTNMPAGDISIGVPKPYLPPSIVYNSYPRGPSVYPFPGLDPTTPPPGFEWKGRDGSVPGDKKGSYQNPGTKEVLSPNLDHGAPVNLQRTPYLI